MNTGVAQDRAEAAGPELLGHPTGLFTLFFAEMWERFSYYGMRALLVFYMMKGFLGMGDGQAYAVYGAYTALVYATPFIGGMLADRILGARRAVVLGGLLMAAGHLVMTVETEGAFYTALALIILGNGFFKPNISNIVGALYPAGSGKRDGGFTVFYMGINLGAAMSPLLCGYVGETFGWHYGFGLATLGMLVGLAVFVAPVGLTRALVLLGALGAAAGLVVIPLMGDGSPWMTAINALVAVALLIAGALAFTALGRGGLPAEAGAPKDPARLSAPAFPGLRENAMPYYLAMVAGTMLLQHVVPAGSHEAWLLVSAGAALLTLPWVSSRNAIYVCVAAAVPIVALLVQRGEIAGLLLAVFGVVALGSLVLEAARSEKVERQRLFVVLILMFFSMLFWAFFEQAGSSVNNFTDRNVDRVSEGTRVTAEQVGQTVQVELTQELIGYPVNGAPLTLDGLEALRKAAETKPAIIALPLTERHVGMGLAREGAELPATVFQAANPIFIMFLGLAFTALWGLLARRRIEPSVPVKFALGLVQLGLGFLAFWQGAETADARGMVWLGWLLLGYLLHTTGELCISPVGLSMVVRLSPKRIVSTVMGAWFLATAFSNYLAGLIATLTGAGGHGEEAKTVPLPVETLGPYAEVFLTIGLAAGGSALLLLALSPLLNRWMHEGPTRP
jgi:POT family proton-dependent oligopeptide transporter